VNKANDLLQKAYEQKDSYPAASLFNSLESIANSNLAIEMIGIGKDAIYDKINRTSQMASFSIEKARNMSIEPILAVSYAEFGRSFEEQDEVNALTYYKYAYMIANMLCLAKGYKGGKLEKNVVINEGNNAGNKEGNSIKIYWPIVAGICFVAGVGIGAAVGRKKGGEGGKVEDEVTNDYGDNSFINESESSRENIFK
jgi:predicted S18 family serine protease